MILRLLAGLFSGALTSAVGGSLTDVARDVVIDAIPDGNDRRMAPTKTQGTGYYPEKPSRGYFGSDPSTAPRSQHATIEEVGYAAGVPPLGATAAAPYAAPMQPASAPAPANTVP